MIQLLDGSGISWTTCKQSAPRSRQITTPTPQHSIFTGRMLFLTPNQQCQILKVHYLAGNCHAFNVLTSNIAMTLFCRALQDILCIV